MAETSLIASRIQRLRSRGWKMPEGCVYVGRPTPFGNPFKVGDRHPRTHLAMRPGDTIQLFREYAELRLKAEPGWLAPLIGKRLACWCPLASPCHADVLLELIAGQVTITANPNNDPELAARLKGE